MTAVLATLAVLLVPQDPTPPARAGQDTKPVSERSSAAAAPGRDHITLVGGEEIVGTILKEVGNYIEVRIDEHTVVGFERSRIRHINAARDAAPATNSALPAKDEWFLLHDERGESAGHMHALIQYDRSGEASVSEEWYFRTPDGRTQVTIIETLDEELRPKSTFYHERVMSNRDRLVTENLLSGKVNGGYLDVRKRSLKGHTEHRYAFPKRAAFPLSFRAKLRQDGATQVIEANQEIFDARTGEFVVVQASTVSRRKVELFGKVLHVREITLARGSRKNSEWVDANHHVVRREVNGASLVAVRVDEAKARRAVDRGGPTGQEPAVAATASGDMALWLPNPIWRVSAQDASRVSVRASLYEGKATLMMLDQVPKEVRLASAADMMLRWLRLGVGDSMRVRARSGAQVQRSPAIRFTLAWSTERPGESKSFRGVCHVFRTRGRYAALFCSAPRASFRDLEADFRRMLDTVQLDAQDVIPRMQGPKQPAIRR